MENPNSIYHHELKKGSYHKLKKGSFKVILEHRKAVVNLYSFQAVICI